MNEINILIVEDESIVAMEIKSYVEKLTYNVVNICSNAKDALYIVENNRVDIVMMDICLKGEMDGIETVSIIKESYPHIEVIFLTAHLDDFNVNRAIKLDPVAYLSKPFNREELRVFLKIAEHKLKNEVSHEADKSNLIILDEEFSYDSENQTLFCCNEMIHLTKKENELLALLIKNKNTIVDFYTIENIVWPDKYTSANTTRTLVKRVRQKLKHKFIETVSSRGYRLITADKSS
ncbi:Two-component hybrid sensor and regulator [hydrothermal vent metagenome]|uniref:Two-component hybrid sensor and regulator n=1 Tax=hydrothermal vent metagenome TaxID=652676 RepID=A0A1W1EDR0_9ZZZZ